ncbi:MAG: hypothetical protein K2K93_03835 [Muribaculaceae bacterium]|nr:hypothetical protein [Muribaculaceae bacterium]
MSGKFFIPSDPEYAYEYLIRDTKIKEAFCLAYNLKYKINFYDLICASLIIPNRNYRGLLTFLYKEIVQTTKDPKLLEISLRVLQKYNNEEIEQRLIIQNGGLNPNAESLIENLNNLITFLKIKKQCYGEIEINDLSFNPNSAEFIAWIIYDEGFSSLPKGSIKIELIDLQSITMNSPSKDFKDGRFQISTETLGENNYVSCAYIQEYTDEILFKFCSRSIRVNQYQSF